MKVLEKQFYNQNMGILIDVRHPLDYKYENVNSVSINIYAEKLIYDPSKYLSKDKKYYIMCKKGILSKKVVIILDRLGYDVTLLK